VIPDPHLSTPLAAKVKKPVAAYRSGFFAINLLWHRSRNKNLGLSDSPPGLSPPTARPSHGAEQRASVSSDRRAQRGSRSLGQGEDLNREGILFPSSTVRFLRRRAHWAMTGTGACSEIAERPPAALSNISLRMGRAVRIRYSTVGVVPSANSADPSSGRLSR
jgi:hypothetical protein